MSGKRLDPIHPGEILGEEFMVPLGLSANALARALGVPVTRISDILRGRRGVSADTALRLARYFGTSPDLWLGLQNEFDLRVAERTAGAAIRRHIPAARSAAATAYPLAGGAESELREPGSGSMGATPRTGSRAPAPPRGGSPPPAPRGRGRRGAG